MVRPAGGVIEGILASDADLLKKYCPEGVPMDLWNQLSSISPQDLKPSNLESYSKSVVLALEHVVLAKVVKRLNA